MTNKEIERLCKRHMAKLLTEFEELQMPAIVLQSVKHKFSMLMEDLKSIESRENQSAESAKH